MDLTIEKLAYGGDGIAREPEALVTFVPRTAPGDVIEAEIVETKPRFRRARLVEVKKPGPERVEPPCGYYAGRDDSSSCGGCQLQHLRYGAQAAAKRDQIEEALRRIGRLDVHVRAPLTARPEESFGYRNKGTFHWAKAAGAFGLVAADGATTIPIASCPLLLPAADRAYRAAATAARELAALAEMKTLIIRASQATGETLVGLDAKPSSAEFAARFAAAVLAKAPVTGIALSKPDGGWERIHGEPTIREKIGDITFRLGVETFLQVNTSMAAKLFREAVHVAQPRGGETVLDLYGGNGGIALSIARRVREVIVVETAAEAVELGRLSAKDNEISNVRFRVGRVESISKTLFHGERVRPDLVFVDPPRAGLKGPVIATLLKMSPPKLVYVSCNPTTLARDLKELVAGGYAVSSVTPVDLFPQTFHVETVVLLERKKE